MVEVKENEENFFNENINNVLKLAHKRRENTFSKNAKSLYIVNLTSLKELGEEEVLLLLEYENVLVQYFKKINGKKLPRKKRIRDYLIKHEPEFYEKYKLLFSI